MSATSDDQITSADLHHESLVFRAQPRAVADCRHQVIAQLRAWRTPVDLDAVELMVSELATNAILHGTDFRNREATIRVELAETAAGLYVQVHDSDRGVGAGGDARPKHDNPETLAESGRGLELVETLASEWGLVGEAGGKFVYFLISLQK